MGKLKTDIQEYTTWNWQVIIPLLVALINVWPAIELWTATGYKHWFYFLLIGILLVVGVISFIKQRWIYSKVVRIVNSKRLSKDSVYVEIASNKSDKSDRYIMKITNTKSDNN